MAESQFLLMRKGQDVMLVELTPEGHIKTTTNPISGANHASAEQFIVASNQMLGGTLTRAKRTDVAGKSAQATHGLKQGQ